ncbi:SusD/RagB family nutrient-binding outer membrane lipoprotein [Pedobacter sp. AK017]|uniref:SusD/RagB family nutrient-binding outer membrane lipoprotein n=1 Tax=Pedobacter sp. AK017 TaxID=2723073 RepID=UPI0021061143|nr:SusD/RagB family nutrient-binding outer membrane lipoprotein [Pedobacter sp. AK017]
MLFGYAVTAWDVSKNSGDSYIAVGFIGQSLSSGADFSDNWGSSNLYNVSTNVLGNTWKVYFSTAGNNLKLAIKNAETANPVNNNAAAQCKILLAQLMYECTTLYGDVPFTQAWDPEKFPYPKYDSQQSVLESVLSLLEEAKAQIDPSSPFKIADYDVFYGGNMSKWTKLANSIKFKTLMVMADKDPSKAAAIGQLVSNPTTMIASAAENLRVLYTGNTNNENPKFRLFGGENPFTYASKAVTDIMVPKNDPRLKKYFDLPTGQTQYIGVPANVDANASTSLISLYLYRKNAPSLILSYQELLFLQAEAYARGLGVAKNLTTANTLYKQALQVAMEFYEADPTDIANYMKTPANGGHLVDLTTAADPVKEIHLEQWVDLMDRPLEAFVQWRRSGPDGSEVPLLTLPKDATPGPLIRRFTLSPDELAANPNIPNPQPKYFDKMWFDL